jgi:hypothetical protein
MVSSWKAAETGTVRVPRSRNGSVRAARPLGYFSLGDLKSMRLHRLVRVDPDQCRNCDGWALRFARRAAIKFDRFSDISVSIGGIQGHLAPLFEGEVADRRFETRCLVVKADPAQLLDQTRPITR